MAGRAVQAGSPGDLAAQSQPADELRGAAGGVTRGHARALADHGVEIDVASAARAQGVDGVDVGCRMDRLQHAPVRPAGDWRRSIPSQSWRSSSAVIAVMRAGCSGWPPVSCSSEEGCSKITGGMSAVPYCSLEPLQTQVAVVGAGAAGLYTALCAARAGGAGDAHLGHPAGRVLQLLGPGRTGRRRGRRRQRASAPRRHAQGGARRRAPLGCARCSAPRRRRRSRTSRASACALTPTATAISRSASRAATARGGSCTRGARRPGVG